VLGINATKVVKYRHARFLKEFGLEGIRGFDRRPFDRRRELRTYLPASFLIDQMKLPPDG
jgi:hypothetical protein